MKKIKLNEADLHKLTTRRLLKYRDALLQCYDTLTEDVTHPEIIKSSDEWKQHYMLVKSILATREHIS